MHTLSGKGIEIGRKCSHKGLTLAGLHLGNLTAVQHYAPDKLHIVMTHIKDTFTRFADRRKRLRQQVIKCIALLQTMPKFRRLTLQLLIGKSFILGFQHVYPLNRFTHALNDTLVSATKDLA